MTPTESLDAFAPLPEAPGLNESAVALADIVQRMRNRDREAAAIFIARYGDVIRGRVRRKLGRGVRRLFDSADVLSTVARRLDHRIAQDGLRGESEKELWALVLKISEAAIVDRYRFFERLTRAESEDGPFAAALRDRVNETSSGGEHDFAESMADVFDLVEADDERQMLLLWLHGAPFDTIAAELDIRPDAARQRWARFRERLRDHLSGSAGSADEALA